jgi:hypothetical protein
MNRWIVSTIAATLACGCGQKAMRVEPAFVAREREAMYKFEGQDVTLVGRATVDGDKLPAIGLADDKTIVHVPELGAWPKGTSGKVVTARGLLRRLTPGGIKTGTPQEQFYLQGVRWMPGDLSKR